MTQERGRITGLSLIMRISVTKQSLESGFSPGERSCSVWPPSPGSQVVWTHIDCKTLDHDWDCEVWKSCRVNSDDNNNNKTFLFHKPHCFPNPPSKVRPRRRQRQERYFARRSWVRRYILIMKKSKWGTRLKKSFIPGDLVVIVNDSAPRNSWILGRSPRVVSGWKGAQRAPETFKPQRDVNKLSLHLEAID